MIARIKWEKIIALMLMTTSIFCWTAFVIESNVYTLALAVIPTFMTLMVIMCYNTIKLFRQQIIKMQ